jgi:hypothetical protein
MNAFSKRTSSKQAVFLLTNGFIIRWMKKISVPRRCALRLQCSLKTGFNTSHEGFGFLRISRTRGFFCFWGAVDGDDIFTEYQVGPIWTRGRDLSAGNRRDHIAADGL